MNYWITTDILERECQALYAEEEPIVYDASMLNDISPTQPLKKVYVYKRNLPVPHFHFVTFGLSQKGIVKEDKRYAYELTLRTPRKVDSDNPPHQWTLCLLLFAAEFVSRQTALMPPSPLMPYPEFQFIYSKSDVSKIVLYPDKEFASVTHEQTTLTYLQIVGLTDDECQLMDVYDQQLVMKYAARRLKFLVTDLWRESLLVTHPEITEKLKENVQQKGSMTKKLTLSSLRWQKPKLLRKRQSYKITLSKSDAQKLACVLPGRIPKGKRLWTNDDAERYILRIEAHATSALKCGKKEWDLFLNREDYQVLLEKLEASAVGMFHLPGMKHLVWQVEE